MKQQSLIIKLVVFAFTALVVCSIAGCAKTMHAGIPVADLSDEQLIEEIDSTIRGMGLAINRAQYLMAVRPEPAYVLTSSLKTFPAVPDFPVRGTAFFHRQQ